MLLVWTYHLIYSDCACESIMLKSIMWDCLYATNINFQKRIPYDSGINSKGT